MTTEKIFYFVDEAGDPTIFDGRGRSRIGTEGCSRYFILGKVDVGEPDRLHSELETLRGDLLADPYFRRVPSMQPEAGKTAVQFHAKDDVAEVRREVFGILRRHDLRMYAMVRDKEAVLGEVRRRNVADAGYRYSETELYDALVSRLFRDRWHLGDEYHIVFAQRGAKPRTVAFEKAIEHARAEYERTYGFQANQTVTVECSRPTRSGGLQAADYLLWSLQRYLERDEHRYLEMMWPQFRSVMIWGEERNEFYHQGNALTPANRAKK